MNGLISEVLMEHFEYVSKTIKRGGEFSAASVMTRESPFDILFDEFGPDTFEVIAITLYGPNKDEYNYIGLSDARFELVEKRFESYLNLNGKNLRQVLEGDKIVQSNLGTFSDTDGISSPQHDIAKTEHQKHNIRKADHQKPSKQLNKNISVAAGSCWIPIFITFTSFSLSQIFVFLITFGFLYLWLGRTAGRMLFIDKGWHKEDASIFEETLMAPVFTIVGMSFLFGFGAYFTIAMVPFIAVGLFVVFIFINYL